MKNVIDFEEYKIKKRLAQFKGTWDLSYVEGLEKKIGIEGHSLITHVKDIDDLSQCIETFREFNIDRDILNDKLSSGRNHYKFPTVISRYRKTIDTFTGLYLFTQEALFKYEDEIPEHRWMLSLLDEDDFSDKLINKISSDIILIERFQKKYVAEYERKSIRKYLNELSAKKDLYVHYLDIFITIKDIDYD